MRVLFTDVAVAAAVGAAVAVAVAAVVAVAVVAAAVVVTVNCRLWRQELLKYKKKFV